MFLWITRDLNLHRINGITSLALYSQYKDLSNWSKVTHVLNKMNVPQPAWERLYSAAKLGFFYPYRSCMHQCKDRSSISLDCDIYQWDHKKTRASYTSCKEIISNWLVTIHVHLVYHQCITCNPIDSEITKTNLKPYTVKPFIKQTVAEVPKFIFLIYY